MATLMTEGGTPLNTEGGNPLYTEALYTFTATLGGTATVQIAGSIPAIARIVAKVKGVHVS